MRRCVSTFSRVAKRPHIPRSEELRKMMTGLGISSDAGVEARVYCLLRDWGTKLRTSGDSCSHRADDDEMSLDPDYDEEGGEESEGGEDDPVIEVKDRTHIACYRARSCSHAGI